MPSLLKIEKPFNAPAVGQTGEVLHARAGTLAARGDGQQNVRERILSLSKWSAGHSCDVCREPGRLGL